MILRYPLRIIVAIKRTMRFYSNHGLWNTFKRVRAEVIWNLRSLQSRRGYRTNHPPFNFLTAGLRKRLLSNNDFAPLVSIIVPCYNHESFLRQRLDSIYQQSYTNYEVILIDDASSDGSVEILREYAERYSKNTRIILGVKNSGSPFYQWRMGIMLANGDLVHIAESDDYCSENFLETLVPFFALDGVELAYADIRFVQNEAVTETLEQYMLSLNSKWGGDFIHTAHEYVAAYLSVKNTIPNASGVVFRKKENLPLLNDQAWLTLHLCGDWIFYLEQMRGGLVAFSDQACAHYRIHEKSSSVNVQRQERYFIEHGAVARCLAAGYRLKSDVFVALLNSLGKFSAIKGNLVDEATLESFFNLEGVWACQRARRPNILMFTFALTSGGGEGFALFLAGGLQEQGCAVTVLNAALAPEMPGMRSRLPVCTPCLSVEQLEQPLARLINCLGADIVHTHHAVLDLAVSKEKPLCTNSAHVVTVHGMYEAAGKTEANTILERMTDNVDLWVYIAKKNLAPLTLAGVIEPAKLRHIPNALPPVSITPVNREKLGINDGDFVLCLASRAIPEKGWEEAVQAVALANATSVRPIKLLLVGSGEMQQRLLKCRSPHTIILGFRENVRDYFAAADIGLLPTRFTGESFPLVVLECLQAGRPVLATAMGEIPYQLSVDNQPHNCTSGSTSMHRYAGILLNLHNGRVNVRELADTICELANNEDEYQELLANVPGAASKFNFTDMVCKYLACYREAMANKNSTCQL